MFFFKDILKFFRRLLGDSCDGIFGFFWATRRVSSSDSWDFQATSKDSSKILAFLATIDRRIVSTWKSSAILAGFLEIVPIILCRIDELCWFWMQFRRWWRLRMRSWNKATNLPVKEWFFVVETSKQMPVSRNVSRIAIDSIRILSREFLKTCFMRSFAIQGYGVHGLLSWVIQDS